MEEVLVECYYCFFCCLICMEDKQPVSSEPPIVIDNPGTTNKIKDVLDRIAS